MLLVIETHPVQYHAPVYRLLQQRHGIPVFVLYQSDRSVAGYFDSEFSARVAWDTDLLSGYESKVLPNGGQSLFQLREKINRLIGETRPAAVLLPGYMHPFYRAAITALWRTNVALLFRAETTDHARRRSIARRAARDFLLRRFYARCRRLLYVGARSREHYRRLGVEDGKLVFSPYCVDSGVFRLGATERAAARARVRVQLGISADERVVMFCGKLSRRKGADMLVPAVSRLERRPTLLFVGDGALRPAIGEAAAKTNVRAFLAGFQNQGKVGDFYHAADLLALPSRFSETWGLVVNEALLHGLPVAASDAVGCVPDLVASGTTGESFRAGSIDGLAAALEAVLKLSDSPNVGAACATRVAQYSVEIAAAGLAQAYREAVL